MACPDTITTKNLTGKHRLNKTLSDNVDETLQLQSVGKLKRIAISTSSFTLQPTHHTDEHGIEHIDVVQTLSAGLSAPQDNLVLDNEEYPKEDSIFGSVIIKTRRVKVEELDIDFLKESWTEDTLEHGLVYHIARSEKYQWSVYLVWGFTIKDGVRKLSRRYRFISAHKPEPIDVKLYYDYV